MHRLPPTFRGSQKGFQVVRVWFERRPPLLPKACLQTDYSVKTCSTVCAKCTEHQALARTIAETIKAPLQACHTYLPCRVESSSLLVCYLLIVLSF